MFLYENNVHTVIYYEQYNKIILPVLYYMIDKPKRIDKALSISLVILYRQTFQMLKITRKIIPKNPLSSESIIRAVEMFTLMFLQKIPFFSIG